MCLATPQQETTLASLRRTSRSAPSGAVCVRLATLAFTPTAPDGALRGKDQLQKNFYTPERIKSHYLTENIRKGFLTEIAQLRESSADVVLIIWFFHRGLPAPPKLGEGGSPLLQRAHAGRTQCSPPNTHPPSRHGAWSLRSRHMPRRRLSAGDCRRSAKRESPSPGLQCILPE